MCILNELNLNNFLLLFFNEKEDNQFYTLYSLESSSIVFMRFELKMNR
jgi:hypothetical protein